MVIIHILFYYVCIVVYYDKNIICSIDHDLSCSQDNQRGLWIGGEMENATNLWKWTASNRSITWSDWYPGRPSSDGNQCILLTTNHDYQGRWNNHDCSAARMHVCEFATI